MSCISCQRCCVWGHAVVTRIDVERLAVYLEIPAEQFVAEHLDRGLFERFGVNAIKSAVGRQGCIFLSRDGCRVYPARPTNCAQFPRHDHIDSELAELCELAKRDER